MQVRLTLLMLTLQLLLVASPITGHAQDQQTVALLQRALSLSQQARESYNKGEYLQSIRIGKEALALIEQVVGPKHPAAATALNNLAEAFRKVGNYAEAQRLHERALKIRVQAFGPTHPDVAQSASNIAVVLSDMGDYGEARLFHQEALRIRERALGATHPDVANSLNNLAVVMQKLGDYSEAQLMLERALQIREQVLGPVHPSVAKSLNNLAAVLVSMGDYSRARPLLERALLIDEKASGPNHPDVATDLSNLAALLNDIGDYASAKVLHERALRIREQALGPAHPDVASSLNNLAETLIKTGDLSLVRPLHERALRIKEQALGPNHPDVAVSLSNLAFVVGAMGNRSGALQLYERALRVREQALGLNHPEVATDLNQLAGLLQDTGDYANARLSYERALRIKEEVLGPTHPEVASVLNNLGLLLWDTGEPGKASEVLERAMHAVEIHTARSLVGLSERQKLAFLRTSQDTFYNYASMPPQVVPNDTMYAAVLRRKNLVFRVLSEERAALTRAPDPKVRPLLERRESLVREMTSLTFRSEQGQRERVVALEKELEQVEAELSRTSAAFRAAQAEARAIATDVCQALPRDAVLLDYVRYSRYTPAQGNKPGRWEASYTVFILRGGRCPNVQRVELGPAVPIDAAAETFRQSLTQVRKIGDKEELLSESEILAKARALGALVLPPSVRQALPGAAMLNIAPDGPLAVVPFQLLPGENGQTYLVEAYPLVTIPSGRDLLHLMREESSERREAAGALLLVGNPDYGAAVAGPSDKKDGHRALPRAGCGLEVTAEFLPLPGTAQEVQNIVGEASNRLRGAAISRAEGKDASEPWLAQKITGQRYVHLATHGYFAGDTCTPPASTRDQRGVVVQAARLDEDLRGPVGTNPLLLSGIALAGANQRARATSGAEDGILTALEVTGLDLRGTELIVLSACETGLGVQHTGQELLGLRWAFGMAGTRSLLTSLWKVPDEPTVRLMTKFYGYLWRDAKDGRPLGKAAVLRQAQLDLMRENRARFNGDSRPIEWAAWVLSGDWQ
ncbi:MAG: CHAT domain-containing tetratricopeptide repeat protein [Nitrospirota bacterium]